LGCSRDHGEFIVSIGLDGERRPAGQQRDLGHGPLEIAAQLQELQYRVLREIDHRAILKFHLGPSLFGGKCGAFFDGEIHACGNPVLSQVRTAVYPQGELHFSLDIAHPHDLWTVHFCSRRWDWNCQAG
jgi:hypothetical protein